MTNLTSIFDLDRTLRLVKPEKQTKRLRVRTPVRFVADDIVAAGIGPVLLDTCVYIDNGHDRLPIGASRLMAPSGAVHLSTITAMELTYAFGRLDAASPDTSRNLAYLRDVLARVPPHRVVDATAADHALAGVLVGTLVRTQASSREQRRKLMLDCLIFVSARRRGLTVLTANVNDFDLLQQLVPDGKVAFYCPRCPAPQRAT